MSAPTRVLVTGSTGFVGRALVAHLRAQGIAVTAASRSAVTGTPDVRLVPVGELGPSTAWNAALEGCSAVVHLAARVHQLHDQAPDPAAEYRRINVEGTVALARAAAAAGVSRFIFMSSVKVHGESSSRPLIETDPLIGSDPYARSKAEAETALLDLAGPMQVMIIRPPLVYGAGVKANFLSMARWLARGVPLPLGAVTGNRRSLVALDNLVSLLSACLESRLTTNESFL
ncbi:MAG TPA: NAD-dependent epimerase/dehydratase family protein, partial [Gemmatimonadales bacterium]